MTVFKREGSPHWQIEFTFKGHKVRQSSGTAKMPVHSCGDRIGSSEEALKHCYELPNRNTSETYGLNGPWAPNFAPWA
ncbi:hypothetical protein MCP1_50116 [Candidatus Terasakiella magnetica]|nr:hypothetical protein MCP1_50116 [Candidatus Terasakiella magnetica]